MAPKSAATALSQWVRDVDTTVLQCRTGRHQFPYLNQAKVTRPKELNGQFLVESACLNGCGAYIRKVYDQRGYQQRSYAGRYDYTEEYRLPDEVREAIYGPEPTMMPSDVNASARVELLKRGGR